MHCKTKIDGLLFSFLQLSVCHGHPVFQENSTRSASSNFGKGERESGGGGGGVKTSDSKLLGGEMLKIFSLYKLLIIFL